MQDTITTDIKYEICIGIKPYFPKSFFVTECVYGEITGKDKSMIKRDDKDKIDGNITISNISKIEYGGSFTGLFRRFNKKPKKLEIKLERIINVLYLKEKVKK